MASVVIPSAETSTEYLYLNEGHLAGESRRGYASMSAICGRPSLFQKGSRARPVTCGMQSELKSDHTKSY